MKRQELSEGEKPPLPGTGVHVYVTRLSELLSLKVNLRKTLDMCITAQRFQPIYRQFISQRERCVKNKESENMLNTLLTLQWLE